MSPAERLCQVVNTNNTYDEFEQVLQENVGEQVDWSALAQMFRLTQTAVQQTGTGSAAADQIQAFTLRYFRDRFAPWIVKQGGWVSDIYLQFCRSLSACMLSRLT